MVGGLTFSLLKITYVLSNETTLSCRFTLVTRHLVFINLDTQFSLCRLEVNNHHATTVHGEALLYFVL